MLVAADYLGSVGVGITSPQFFRADDGKVYIVKLQNNRLGTKVLVNEFLGAKFGEIMTLCFPPSDIIEINEQILQKSPELISLGASPGRHFASQYLEHAKYMTEHRLYQVVNIAEMAGIMLFDHIFHNSDRISNRRNLLLRKEDMGYQIYAIDNSHLFRSGRWTLESLNSLSIRIKVYYQRSYGFLLRELLFSHDFVPYMEKFEKLSDQQIVDLVQDIPREWLPDETERLAIAHYIRLRRDMVREIWGGLCKQIPRSRGGRRFLCGKVISAKKQRMQKG